MQKKKVGKADDAFFFIINIQVSSLQPGQCPEEQISNIVTSIIIFPQV